MLGLQRCLNTAVKAHPAAQDQPAPRSPVSLLQHPPVERHKLQNPSPEQALGEPSQ